jgi:hypothetical protein
LGWCAFFLSKESGWKGWSRSLAMHEVNVQRAMKEARRKLGIAVLTHELGHG